MKIAILTITPTTNYGGIMQAYALQEILKERGHNVWIINNVKKDSRYRSLLIIIKRILKKYLYRKDIVIFSKKEKQLKSQNTQLFINRYLQLTDKYHSSKDLMNLDIEHFDVFVVGSDQVWRPKYVSNILDYFLYFAKGFTKIRRISYAASFGVDESEFSSKELDICSNLIQQFDAVSVREDSGIELSKKYLGIEPEHVLDPTLLLVKERYIQLINNSKEQLNTVFELFTYILDRTEDKEKAVQIIASNLDYSVTQFNTKAEDAFAPIQECIAPSVEGWLKGFNDAKYIITDSFHACVFSIIFNKPFLIYGNTGRGLSRFSSILKLFGLEDRLVLSSEDITNEILKKEINWEAVNSILREQQVHSLKFLENGIGK